MDGKAIARIIDSEIASRGMPKAEFHAKSGVSSATLSQWRTGKYEPTQDKLAKVEKCLGISFAEYEKSDMDDEEAAFLQMVREDYSYRALFESAKSLTKEQRLTAAAYIERLKAGDT